MTVTAEPTWYEDEALAFRQRVLAKMSGLSPRELADLAVQLDHDEAAFMTTQALAMYPGANILSPRVRRLLASVVASRASEGHPGAKYQTGLVWAEEAETMATELVGRVFEAEFAEVRPLSGSMANMAVFNSLTEPGDTIFSLSTPVGGHISHAKVGAAGYRRLEIHNIPYDAHNWQIRLDELREQVLAHPPKLIIVGASLILFEYPLREIREIADEVGALVMYDAAHVAGMIAGGVWQHPLKEGAHIMTASTYKSFGGPPGGIAVTNDAEIARGLDRAIFPGMTANYHTNRMAALAVGAAEMLEFGQAYAQTSHRNARALAAGFAAEGLTVAGQAQGATDGHMLALDVSERGGGAPAAAALEAANIICNFNLLPWDSPRLVRNPSGLRLAVHEITRWGMQEAQMLEIAALYADVLLQRRVTEDVRRDVVALKAAFNEIQYCFPEDS